MTQTKTAIHLKAEQVQTAETIWMDAAAKTIAEANLQDRFRHHLSVVAKERGQDDLFHDLQMPDRGKL